METLQIVEAMNELEERIDRLRALYEQYFQGIERIEPLTLRKEVARRIHDLRREQIRNTGLRYRFQMLVQRFNSFQQYWGRVTREIEAGTYRRDVLRVAARFGEAEALTIMGRKRAQKYLALAAAQAARRAKDGANTSPPATLSQPPEELSDDDLEVLLEDDDLEEIEPQPVSREAARATVPARSTAAAAPAPSHGPAASASGSRPPGAPRRRISQLVAQVRAKRATEEGAKPSVPPPGPTPASRGPALDLDIADDLEPRGPGAAVRPRPLRPGAFRAEAPDQPRPPPGADAGVARANNVAPAGHSRQQSGGVPAEPRLRQIYEQYVEARRRTNEGVAGVTYERLSASLRAQAANLRAAHPTRSVDYEVIVQGGRALLKPILR